MFVSKENLLSYFETLYFLRIMTTEETLKEFRCAASIDRHFLIDPISLFNCGHSVCKNCFEKNKINSIKCKVCGIVTEQEFSKIQVSKGLKQALKLSLGSIFEYIEKETVSKLNELKSNFYVFSIILNENGSYLELF